MLAGFKESWKIDYGLAVDKIITSFVLPTIEPSEGIPAGIDSSRFRPGRIHMLYDAARRTQGRPLCLLGAEKLLDLKRDSTVVILTGVHHPVFFPKGETDGPPGAVALARALSLGLGLRPVIVTDKEVQDVVAQTALSIGLVSDWDFKAGFRPRSVSVRGFPLSKTEDSKKQANALVDELQPSAVVAIERKGRNSKGEYHSLLGTPRSASEAKLDYVADVAMERGAVTIGIGDNGNEIGFGNILDDVRRIQMFGENCRCPCTGGIATVVKTDVLIPASTSNWGAYGMEACIAILTGNHDLMHDGKTEERVLTACAATGCADGGTIESTPTCDGTGMASVYVVDLLKTLVDHCETPKKREF